MVVLLERNEKGCAYALQALSSVCKAEGQENKVHQGTISDWDPCPWNSSPWIWLVDYPGPPVAMSMPLTVICMLNSYVFCIPLKTKTAEEIVDKYLTHVAFTFGNSRKILSDNCTEFKNALFKEVAKQLGVKRKIYSPVYRPQANGCIEGFYKFLKECISKHMVNSLEWDDILPLVATAYNWFPNEHSKEPSFFLMFGRDAATNSGPAHMETGFCKHDKRHQTDTSKTIFHSCSNIIALV